MGIGSYKSTINSSIFKNIMENQMITNEIDNWLSGFVSISFIYSYKGTSFWTVHTTLLNKATKGRSQMIGKRKTKELLQEKET